MKGLLSYCRAHITDFGKMEREALARMDEQRCDLKSAAPELYMKMADAIEDWGMENDVDVSEIDVEEVFWEE